MQRPRIVPKVDPRHDPEVGEVKVNLGIISARAVLNRSGWESVRRFFRRTPLEEQVAIPSADAFVHVLAPDHGLIDLHLEVVNFSKVPLQIEQLTIEWFGMAGRSLTVIGPQPLGISHPILRGRVGVATFRFLLVAAGVRELVERISPAQSSRSSPGAEFRVRGLLLVSHKANRAKLQFEVPVESPRLVIPPSIASGDSPRQ